MEMWQTAVLAISALLLLLCMRVPIAFSLLASGVVGLLTLQGTGYSTSTLGAIPYTSTASFTLTVIPMFILMGMFAVRANIARNVFEIANFLVARFPGGLGVATVMACAGFAAVSGSSVGTAATMARLSVGEMRSKGYSAQLATGLVAVAGTLGVMIPPSTILVLFAVLAQESVGQMLAAGIIPGLISALAYILYIMVAAGREKNRDDSATLAEGIDSATDELNDRAVTFTSLPWRGLLHIAIIFSIVIGGMYSGVFTATESAAMGATAALVILLIEQRSVGIRQLWREVRQALLDTAETSSMVFFVVVGSAVFSAYLVASGITRTIVQWSVELPISPLAVMAVLLVALIPLGMFLDSMSILILSVPLLVPIADEFGFSSVWLGILMVKFIEIGLVTPPVGINGFVVAGTTGVKAEQVFRGAAPLIAIDLIVTAILFLFPALTLFLPSLVVEG